MTTTVEHDRHGRPQRIWDHTGRLIYATRSNSSIEHATHTNHIPHHFGTHDVTSILGLINPYLRHKTGASR